MTEDLADRLLCLLRAKTGVPTLAYSMGPGRLTGGFWAELLAFSLADAPPGWEGELVARVMPDPKMAAKETVVQAAVADAGMPTPAVRGAGGPDDGLGRAFMVMDRATGEPLLAGLDGVGAILGAPGRLWRMPDVLASVMAQLHAIDPTPIRQRLEAVDGVTTTVPEMVDVLRARADDLGRRDLVNAGAWLIDHAPPSAEAVICHGDLHPFNVLSDGSGHVTLLDWSATLIGSRAYDVGFTSLVLANPPIVVPPAARPVIAAAGRALANHFVRSYRRHSGVAVDPSDVAWHQALVALRALVEVAQWVDEGVVERRAGHPWLIAGDRFAAGLSSATGVSVRPR